MEEVLAINGVNLPSLIFYGSIIAAILWETVTPRRSLSRPAWIRWINNLGLWLTGILLKRLLIAGLAVTAATYIEQQRIGLLQNLPIPDSISILLGVLLLDFFATLKHRLFHVIPILWRLHLVHHSDTDCDVSTSFRSHPVDSVVDGTLTLLILIAIGAPPTSVYIFYLLAFLLNPLRHANIYIPPRIDRILRFFVVTPDYHRIHHSSVEDETNSNFGTIFPWWDWLMHTYRQEPRDGQYAFRIGLEYFRVESEMWLPNLLSQPFRLSRETPAIAVADDREVKTGKPQSTGSITQPVNINEL